MFQNPLRPFLCDPGQFRHRIKLYEPSSDEELPWTGNPADAQVAEVWAAILQISAMEQQQAEQGSNEKRVDFLVRHRTDLGAVKQILFNEARYDLLSVHDPDQTGRWLVLQTRSSLGDG